MKNIIYQYWDGTMNSGAIYGAKVMKEYANRIGAEYLFEDNPRFRSDLGAYSPHYGQFKVVYDKKFEDYDNVLFTDTDVFPVKDLRENIFENFNADIGICTEDHQPKMRLTSNNHINSRNDELWAAAIKAKWNVDMPRTSDNLLKVYNSGVVLYSREGIKAMKERFVPFYDYVGFIFSKRLPDFYASDQGYIHAMLKVAKLNFKEMDAGWNSFVHYVGDPNMKPRPVNDMRTSSTKFVHVQLRGADHYDENKLWRITNLPEREWQL